MTSGPLDYTQPDDRMYYSLTLRETNAVQSVLEHRAREESEQGKLCFMQWLDDTLQTPGLAPILCPLFQGTAESVVEAKRAAWQLQDDYIQYRVANADEDEMGEIARELFEPADHNL